MLTEYVQSDIDAYGKIGFVPRLAHRIPEAGVYSEPVNPEDDVDDDDVYDDPDGEYTDVPSNIEVERDLDLYADPDEDQDEVDGEDYDYAWKSTTGATGARNVRGKTETMSSEEAYDEPLPAVAPSIDRARVAVRKAKPPEAARSDENAKPVAGSETNISNESKYVNVPLAQQLNASFQKTNAIAKEKAAENVGSSDPNATAKRKKQSRGPRAGAYENTGVEASASATSGASIPEVSAKPTPVPRQKKPGRPDETLPPMVSYVQSLFFSFTFHKFMVCAVVNVPRL